MANSDAIEVEGIVVDVLGWGKYKIKITDMDLEIEAYAAGKMKKFNIRIIPGDLVKVQLSPYEPTKWRIVYRSINKKWSKAPRDSASKPKTSWPESNTTPTKPK